MNLYSIKRASCGRDEVREFVVRALTPKVARVFASEQAGDEGADTWLSPGASTCENLTPHGLGSNPGAAGVVVRAFVPG